jgi:hypothetical protein
MQLKKLVNNVIFLQIIVTILIIFLSYAVVKNNQYEKIAFRISYEKLNQAMKEVREMERLSKVMVNRKSNELNKIDFYAIEEILEISRDTEDILELNNYHSSWREIRHLSFNMRIILSEEQFNNKKLEYLKEVSRYLEEISELYKEHISKDLNHYQNTLFGEKKFFRDYKNFMVDVNQLLSEEKLRSLRYD